MPHARHATRSRWLCELDVRALRTLHLRLTPLGSQVHELDSRTGETTVRVRSTFVGFLESLTHRADSIDVSHTVGEYQESLACRHRYEKLLENLEVIVFSAK